MALSSDSKFSLIVGFLCTCWYLESCTSNVLNKIMLQQFPYPLTVAMSSLWFTGFGSIPIIKWMRIPNRRLSKGYMIKYLIPLGFGKIVALGASFTSIWKIPVSYAHTIKATMPLFAVLFARIILKERQTTRVYISLIPIMVGVGIASVTELSFNLFGLCAAVTATATYAVLNVAVKKVLQDSGLHHLKLLSLVAQIACIILLPIWCLHDLLPIWRETTRPEGPPAYFHPTTLVMVGTSGFLNFLQNLVTFTLINKLTALSYAVSNAGKRIFVITVSLILLKNPVTSANLFGMVLSIVGVFTYNRAKQRSKNEKVQYQPFYKSFSHATLSDATLFQRYSGSNGPNSTVLDVSLSRVAEENDEMVSSLSGGITISSPNHYQRQPTTTSSNGFVSIGLTPSNQPQNRSRLTPSRFYQDV